MVSRLSFFIVTLLCQPLLALTIVADYGKSIQVQVELHDDIKPNQKFKLVDKSGKTAATAVVESVDGSSAWMAITSGSAQVGLKLVPEGLPAAPSVEKAPARATNPAPAPVPAKDEPYEFGREELDYEAPFSPQKFKKRKAPKQIWRAMAGFDSFTFRGGAAANAERKVGIALGAKLEMPWQKNLTFESGALYYQAGAQYVGTKINLNYLGVPATANWKVAPYWQLKGGLMLSYLLNKSGTGAPTDKFDYLVLLGPRYKWSGPGKYRFSLDLDYLYGLKRFDGDISNSGIQFLFGWTW